MKKQTQSTAIVAKCCDGAFRKITMITPDDNGINAMTKYGQIIYHGRYSINDNDQPVFVKAS